MIDSLPESLSVSFMVAASELGMASAARIFVEDIARALGDDGVAQARDAMRRTFSVFDSVASSWLETGRVPHLDVAALLDELRGARRILIGGFPAILLPGAGRLR